MPQKATTQHLQKVNPEFKDSGRTPEASGLVVAQIATNLEDIGSTEDMIAMANYLVNQNGRSIVISSGGPGLEDVLKSGSECHQFSFKKREVDGHYGFFSAVKTGYHLNKILKASQIDVVHLHSQSLIQPVYVACQFAKIPLIVKVDDPLGYVKHAPVSLFKKTPLLTHLEKHKQQLVALGVPEQQIKVVPLGYDGHEYRPDKINADDVDNLWAEWDVPTATRVMYVPTRHLESSLGLDKFIGALAPLKNLPFKAIISGDYSHSHLQFTELWQKVENLELSKQVLFVGPIEDKAQAYAAADMVICPHQFSPPVSRAPLKAQALGKPVIATDLDVHKAMITHNETGWLYPPDNPQKLTELLKKAMVDNVRLHKMGAKGAKQVAKINSYEIICPQTYALYQELLAQNKDEETYAGVASN